MISSAAMAPAFVGCSPSPEEQQRASLREEIQGSFAKRDAGGADSSDQHVAHPKRVTVAQGRSPVVFDARAAGTVHVIDLTAGTELLTTNVGRDQWISINEDNGVLIGSSRVLAGPLPEGHQFAIQIEVGGDENFASRAGTDAVPPTPPTRVIEPTTQPISLPPIKPETH